MNAPPPDRGGRRRWTLWGSRRALLLQWSRCHLCRNVPTPDNVSYFIHPGIFSSTSNSLIVEILLKIVNHQMLALIAFSSTGLKICVICLVWFGLGQVWLWLDWVWLVWGPPWIEQQTIASAPATPDDETFNLNSISFPFFASFIVIVLNLSKDLKLFGFSELIVLINLFPLCSSARPPCHGTGEGNFHSEFHCSPPSVFFGILVFYRRISFFGHFLWIKLLYRSTAICIFLHFSIFLSQNWLRFFCHFLWIKLLYRSTARANWRGISIFIRGPVYTPKTITLHPTASNNRKISASTYTMAWKYFTFSVIFVGLTLFQGFVHFSSNLLLELEDLFTFPKVKMKCVVWEFAILICFQYSSLMLVARLNNPPVNVDDAKGKDFQRFPQILNRSLFQVGEYFSASTVGHLWLSS